MFGPRFFGHRYFPPRYFGDGSSIALVIRYPDLTVAIRATILADSDVAPLLATYLGIGAVFTRRPVPADAVYPFVVISPGPRQSNQDVLSKTRPVRVREIAVYGQNGTAAHYRAVEQIAYMIRALFHRQKESVSIEDYDVVDVIASGPTPAPTDDDETVGRTIRLVARLQPQG